MRAFTEADRGPLLDLLKMHGPANAPALARIRGVNLTAVRQQLAALQREGLASARVERRKVGRPTHLWTLTEKAEALFPQGYGPLALGLLRQLRELDGERKVTRLLERRSKELAEGYRKRLRGRSPEERWQELARIRAEEGYMARPTGEGLAEHHCPIAAIAKEFPQVCRLEQQLFESVLGRKLERLDHLASGGRACVYAAPPRPARRRART
jgi:predicted ArsR family transcriptional regulator